MHGCRLSDVDSIRCGRQLPARAVAAGQGPALMFSPFADVGFLITERNWLVDLNFDPAIVSREVNFLDCELSEHNERLRGFEKVAAAEARLRVSTTLQEGFAHLSGLRLGRTDDDGVANRRVLGLTVRLDLL